MKIIRKLKNIAHKRQAKNAARKYGNPERQLKFIGVTGTDGKTTTVSLIYHILQTAGLKVGYISTVEAKIGQKALKTGLHVTSPDPWDLPKYLAMMVEAGIEYVVLETTSMGLDQNRFGDIKFDAAVITNIREDHIDYHGSWESYATSKFGLLKLLKEESIAVLNADDERAATWLQKKSDALKQNIFVRWSSRKLAEDVKKDFGDLRFKLGGMEFQIPIIGADYNIDNIVQAILLCEPLVSMEKIRKSLESFALPKGRMELMLGEPVKIIVDFAHTPAALERALEGIRDILPKGRRLITVFGCAGRRDKGRRRMGAVSAIYSDLTILTAEDPRSERLAQINTEILAHAHSENGEAIYRFRSHDDYALTGLGEIHAQSESSWKKEQKPFICFDEDSKTSRRDAIELAIRLARRGDCVFITGKGHEESLAFGKDEKEFTWSDQKEVKATLKRLKIIH